MKLVKTKDDSYTFYSDEYNEGYHSISGALDEALRKFIEPCKIKNGMKILDVGFGLGYNVGMAMFKAKKLRIISLEKELLEEIQKLKVPNWFKESYDKVKLVAKKLEYKDDNYEIKLILGDATKTIKEINEKFDVVFLDPFSPKKNKELWTKEFLKEIKKRMKKNGILATYSCASLIRKNLNDVGFIVSDGPCVGRRAPGTIARVA